MSIKSWKARGLTLSPGPDGFHVDDLVMFARKAQDQFPNGTVQVGEHGDLRVISYEGECPYFDWRD